MSERKKPSADERPASPDAAKRRAQQSTLRSRRFRGRAKAKVVMVAPVPVRRDQIITAIELNQITDEESRNRAAVGAVWLKLVDLAFAYMRRDALRARLQGRDTTVEANKETGNGRRDADL